MKNKTKFYFLFFIFCILSSNFINSCLYAEFDQVIFEKISKRRFDIVTIKTIYGDCQIKTDTKDNVLLEIIRSDAFQRLKNIHQYGITHFVRPDAVYSGPHDDYTRYEHSICAMVIARKFQLPLEEQIATLIHDIKHTAFSHVGDILFKQDGQDKAYHDLNLKEFLKETRISKILRNYNINIDSILPENIGNKSLKKPSPMLCTDRIEYTIHGAYIAGLLNKEDISQIISNLKYNHNQEIWYFENQEIALKFAEASLDITVKNSGAAWNAIIYTLTSLILDMAIKKKIITELDIKYYLSDDKIWKLLNSENFHSCLDGNVSTDDDKITNHLLDEYLMYRFIHYLENNEYFFKPLTKYTQLKNSNIHIIKTVCRGVDPQVLCNDNPIPVNLSSIDENFALLFNKLKTIMEQDGWKVKFKIPQNESIFVSQIFNLLQFQGC
ncbi:hypothetical protein K9L05_01930 [Candidatus Babeliales bacterium]|nr:hypothetical protein [Candidatus Babeliales bacterium]